MSVGKRIYLKRNLPDKALMEEFAKLPASNVADCMERSCAMNPRIKLISSALGGVCGPAFTVKCRAGDNLALHAALTFCQEGDVLIVSNEEDTTRALTGEVMLSYLFYTKKAAAIVIDGPIRDMDNLTKWPFPIYCTGATPGGPYKEGPGEVNVPVACGGISVDPGDIILADRDGIVVIPPRDAGAVLEKAKKFHEADEAKAQAAKEGRANRDWVLKALEAKGFEIIDEVY